MKSITMRLVMAFLLALALTILPLPELAVNFRPPWVLMLVLYLQFYLSDYFNVVLVFILGLVLDALLSTVIGEHALALSLVAWLASNKARRFYLFSIAQQLPLIGFFCLFYQLILIIINAFLGFYDGFFSLLGSTALGMVLWPWVRLIGEDVLLAKMKYL